MSESQSKRRWSSVRSAFQPARMAGATNQRRVLRFLGSFGKKRRLPWSPVIAVIALVVAAWWTNDAVYESLHDMFRDKLRAICDTHVAALELWIGDVKTLADSWAKDPQVMSAAEQLQAVAETAAEPAAALLAAPQLAEVRRRLAPLTHRQEYRNFTVIGRSGVVLVDSGRDENRVGRRLTRKGMEVFAAVLEGETIVTRPSRRQELYEGQEAVDLRATEMAVPLSANLAVLAPIRAPGTGDDGEIIGGLVFVIDADRDLTRILDLGRTGDTGETYVFGPGGYMLSESRFGGRLRELGILPEGAPEDIIYTMQLRDPGGDLTRGFDPGLPASALPFTRMAASAIAGEDGVDVVGYRDYRGVEVIGAWRWLEQYGFGLATEVDRKEAYRVLRPLRISYWALFVILSLSAAAIVSSTYAIKVLARRIDDVEQLGQYRLEEKIGEGGMGRVYLARHAMLRRPTALKTLKPDALSPENVVRFEREVQLTSQLTHPSTIEIFDYGRSPEGVFYYVMEYLTGVNLSTLVEFTGPLPPARVIYILRQACGSLEEAHHVGLVHRDIKPMNIMLCRRGMLADVAKVLDFGLVKDVSTPQELQVTSADVVGGTPPYIAPERLKDPTVSDPRSDLYSLGGVAFHLLTGRDVFEGTSAMQIAYKAMHEEPPRPSEIVQTPIPAALEQLVMDCLARDPDMRPATATDIIATLDSIAVTDRQWHQVEARAWWAEHEATLAEKCGFRPFQFETSDSDRVSAFSTTSA